MADHAAGASDTGTSSGADPGGGGPAGSAGQSGVSVGTAGTSTSDYGFGAHDDQSSQSATSDRGFFGGIMDAITDNPVANALGILGLVTGVPAFGLMGLAARIGKAYGDPDSVGPVGPGPEGDGPITPTVGEIQQATGPKFNPVEDLVGSEYVAYNGMKADEIRQKLFPYMNFNQPTQPGIQGLVGQYAGVGKDTGLMTGPFGMSNTQV